MTSRLVLIALAAFGMTLNSFAAEKPADAIAFLVKKMGAESVSLKGKTPEMLYDCGIEFAVVDGNLAAYFYHPEGSKRDIRGTFEIKAKTKVKSVDAKRNAVTVDNTYVVTEDGRTSKSTYRARMEVELTNAGAIRSVNIGWNRDKQDPLMYRCVMN